jgi:hypothetical protein
MMLDAPTKKRAWLVIRPSTLDLQDDAGRIIRRMICGGGSNASAIRARDLLEREASSLGFSVVGERRDTRRFPRTVSA